MSFRIFGQKPAGKRLERLIQSVNYKKNGFENISPTPMMADDTSYFKMFRDFMSRSKNTAPASPLPSVKTDLKNIASVNPVIIWFGHSSYFIRIQEKNILVDPVFSGSASPFSFMVKSFAGSDIYTPDDMPDIDYLIITHDHYDHLDYKSIVQLKTKTRSVICSAGVGSHLEYWGFDNGIIQEMDWWETIDPANGMTVTATPARHFSGRGISRGKTLWSSFILKAGNYNLFLGGDSGYDRHFKEIGDIYGPFDIAILESGQYNVSWPLIHMMPEQTVLAALDLKAKVLMPVHWGKFTLALHPWDEPVERISKNAKEMGQKITTPKIGELVILDQSYLAANWWKL